MNLLNTKKIYFILHDCFVNSIEKTPIGIILNFDDGIYIEDNSTYKLKKNCKLVLSINKFKGNENCHVSITKYHKAKRTEIDFGEFIRMLNKAKFKVYLDYYSDFAKSILIKGSISNIEIELIITEIEDLKIEF